MKKKMILLGPSDTKSGYGYRSKDLFRAIIELYKDDYEIEVSSRRWGSTPFGSLDPNNQNDKLILDRIRPEEVIKSRQADVSVQVSVPNEFQPYAKYNIGVTAGIETNACSIPWLNGLNRVDLNLVSSNHSKNILTHTTYTSNDQSQQLKNIKPTEVLFEGYDDKIYNPHRISGIENDITKEIDNIPEDFLYLTVGHWLPGDFSHDRKNISGTLYTFFEAFKSFENKPALIIKTAINGYSTTDKLNVEKRINEVKNLFSEEDRENLPNVYLLYGDLSANEMATLYGHPKIKSMLLLTRGEGFGRPFLEFGAFGKPIITSGWSGHLDFLKADEHVLVGGSIQPVHPSAQSKDLIIDGSSWFAPDFKQSVGALIYVFTEYKKALLNAKKGQNRITNEFKYKHMKNKIKSIFDQYLNGSNTISNMPQPEMLKLPKLQLK